MHRIFSKYLGDPEIGKFYSDRAYIRQMVRVETILAEVQGQLGIIPSAAAAEIVSKLPYVSWDLEAIALSTEQNGIPVIGLLSQGRDALSPESAAYLHYGITSQDVSDTAQVLMCRDYLAEIERRIRLLLTAWKHLDNRYGSYPMAARTRNQVAVPMVFSRKIAGWTEPLERCLQQLDGLRTQLLVLQLAGADGNLTGLGNKADTAAQQIAKTLQLRRVPVWHSQRDRWVLFGDFLGMVCSCLGKIGTDLLALSQSEVGEIIEGGKSGGSSSMPHKQNPVRSEALMAVSQYGIGLSGILKQAMIHRGERDGSGLCLEWLTLPALMGAAGTALHHAMALATSIIPDPDRMRANLDRSRGLVFSERATYLLSSHMEKTGARKVVEKACELVAAEGLSLAEALRQVVPDIAIDWDKELKY